MSNTTKLWIAVVVLLVVLVLGYVVQPKFLCKDDDDDDHDDNLRPIISLADLMIEKLTSPEAMKDSTRNDKTLVNQIIRLRSFDATFYNTLYKEGGELKQKYFYSRRGSCCPCSYNEPSCCICPPDSGLGGPDDGQSGKIFDSNNSVFKFTSIASPQETFIFNDTLIDKIKVYTIPKDTKPNTYTATIKSNGGAIDLTLTIEVVGKGSFHIVKIQ